MNTTEIINALHAQLATAADYWADEEPAASTETIVFDPTDGAIHTRNATPHAFADLPLKKTDLPLITRAAVEKHLYNATFDHYTLAEQINSHGITAEEVANSYLFAALRFILPAIRGAAGEPNTPGGALETAAAVIIFNAGTTLWERDSKEDKLDSFRNAWCDILTAAEKVEAETARPLDFRTADLLAELATRLLKACYLGGEITADLCTRAANGDTTGGAPATRANEITLRAENVSFRLFGKGHHTAYAEQLGGDTMSSILDACHITGGEYERYGADYEGITAPLA